MGLTFFRCRMSQAQNRTSVILLMHVQEQHSGRRQLTEEQLSKQVHFVSNGFYLSTLFCHTLLVTYFQLLFLCNCIQCREQLSKQARLFSLAHYSATHYFLLLTFNFSSSFATVFNIVLVRSKCGSTASLPHLPKLNMVIIFRAP